MSPRKDVGRPPTVKAAVVQARSHGTKEATVDRQVELTKEAIAAGANIVCLQELCNSPYFCQETSEEWFDWAEEIPEGPTYERFAEVAREENAVIVLPIFERDGHVFYNTAAIIDAGGEYLGKYRKLHIPETNNFFEKYYFRPGNLGTPVFDTKFGRIGVLICYDRHFPEGARLLGLQGAEIVFVPTATAGRTKDLWMVESRAHAIANGYFVGSVNRVGVEKLEDVEFYGSSYFCDPMGRVLVQGSDNEEEFVIADIDLSEARPQFYHFRDRRPDAYGELVAP